MNVYGLIFAVLAFVFWVVIEIIRFEGREGKAREKRKKVSHNVLIFILVFYACAQLALIIASFAG